VDLFTGFFETIRWRGFISFFFFFPPREGGDGDHLPGKATEDVETSGRQASHSGTG